MSQELVVRSETAPMVRSTANPAFEDVQRVGNLLAASGYFSDVRDMAQAAVKVMAGQELGIPPVASMMGINIIKGKVALGAHLIASRVRAHGYDFRIKTHTDKGCAIEFLSKRGDSLGVSSFTEDDAKAAGVLSEMYRKYPRNMYYSRAMSNGAKWYCPDVFGGAPIYTPEELGAEVDGDGEMVQPGSQAAANAVRDRKLAEAGVDTPIPEVKESKTRKPKEAPKVSFDLLQAFGEMKKELGESLYYEILGRFNYKSSTEIETKANAIPVYKALGEALNDKRLGVATDDASLFLSPAQADDLVSAWTENNALGDLPAFLKACGVPTGKAEHVPVEALKFVLSEIARVAA